MKFTSLKDTMRTGLRIVSPAVYNHSVLPILQNVRLAATGDGQLTLSAADLEIRIDHRMTVKIEQPGETTVPARLLTDFVGSLPDEQIDFLLEDRSNKLHVTCGAHHATFLGTPASEFPYPPTFENDAFVATIPGDVFGTMLKRVLIAASKDRTSRPVLAGVLVHFEGDALTLAAADGFRLSKCIARFDAEKWEKWDPTSVIVPSWGLSNIKRPRDEEVRVFIVNTPKQSQARFSIANTDVTCQLIEGRFPDYDQIIPTRHDMRTHMQTDVLLQACKTARIFAKHEAEILRLSVREDCVTVSATTAEMGDVEAQIGASVYGDEKELDIAFNVSFLIEALSVMGSEKVVMQTTTSNDPATVRPPGEEDFTHVLMPMSIK